MVAPHTEAVNTESITQHIGSHSHALWNQWLTELNNQTAHKVAFTQSGTLVISHPQDEPDWQRFQIKARAVVAKENIELIDSSSLTAMEPELASRFSKGLFFPQEGVIDNIALYPALNAYFKQSKNIRLIENTTVTQLSDKQSKSGYLDETKQSYDYIFDCRGNGARADLSQFRSVRGEVARVFAPEVNIKRVIRLIHPRFPLYIAPRNNHEYIIGATQIESDADTPVTVRSGLELLSALYSLHPGFGEAQILQLIAGLRPTFFNNLPRINVNQKLIRINGLYRHGYLFSPTLIEDVLSLIFETGNTLKFPQFIKTFACEGAITA